MFRTDNIFTILLIFAQGALAGDIEGTVTFADSMNADNCIVYINQVNEVFEPPSGAAVMDQVNLEFRPHVLPIIVGTRVDFLNSDKVLHNVFTPSVCGGKLDLGTWAKGEIRSYVFKEKGCVSVMLCNVHPEMEAWILVLQNSYYTAVLDDGSYLIENVPPGNYELIAWHERYSLQKVKIHVPATGKVHANISLNWR